MRILIVGGGTAGWMTAAAFAKILPPSQYEVTLIESSKIGTVGVGEATIPHIREFNALLGIDENEFIRATNATYKLAIQFEDWGAIGTSYMHPFGGFGHDLNGIEFQHYWLKLREAGISQPLDHYSMAVVAARRQRFDYPSTDPESPLSNYAYAFHLDAGLYAAYLRRYSERKSVVRKEGVITQVEVDAHSGDIGSVSLDSGENIPADFYIDCSGFRGLLIEKTLETGFENWSNWLPCDRAVAVPCEKKSAPTPFTRAIAKEAGWQWRIPLQHRTGNGYVYSSSHISDSDALNVLLKNIDGAPTAEPNLLKFVAGRRVKSWNKNCVAIGLSGGFLEPLESTSIYLIQMGILKLLELFPELPINPQLRDEFNRAVGLEYVRIRDFLVLHYHATQRNDTPFWDYCRTMPIPESLKRKIDLFRASAHIEKYQQGLFMTPSWLAVYLGQGVYPQAYDSRLAHVPTGIISTYFEGIKQELESAAEQLSTTEQAIARACLKIPVNYPKSALNLYGVNP